MTAYNELISLATKVIDANDKLQTKYTKAESKRIRALINSIQKRAVMAKKALIAKDAE